MNRLSCYGVSVNKDTFYSGHPILQNLKETKYRVSIFLSTLQLLPVCSSAAQSLRGHAYYGRR